MCKWQIRFLEIEEKYRDLVVQMTVNKVTNNTRSTMDITLKIKVYTDKQTIGTITDLFAKSIRHYLTTKTQLELF